MKLQEISNSSSAIYENAELELKTITPIHIMGRTEIGSHRLLITDKVRAIVDEEKLFERLYQQDELVDDFLFEMDSDKPPRLYKFLKNRVLSDQSWGSNQYVDSTKIDKLAWDLSAYRLDWYHNAPQSRPYSIRPFIRDGQNDPYIPGTSIKGAIRTAVLYSQLLKLKEESSTDFNLIVKKIREELPKVKSSSTKPAIEIGLIEDVLQDFDALAPNNHWFTPKEVSLRDFLKAVLISDTTPARDNLQLCRVQWVSEGGPIGWHFSTKSNGDPIDVYPEVLPESITLSCNGAVDKFTVNRLRGKTSIAQPCFSDLDSVFAHMKRFADDLLTFEKKYFQDLYNRNNDPLIRVALKEYERIENKEPNLRIGWASGTMGITILRLLLDEPDMRILDQPEIEAIREQFFPSQHATKYGPSIKYFPKTRRFIVSQSNQTGSHEDEWELITPLGWCRLEREGGS